MCRLLPTWRSSGSAEAFGLRLMGEVALLPAEQCFAFNRFSNMGGDFDATGLHGLLLLLFFARTPFRSAGRHSRKPGQFPSARNTAFQAPFVGESGFSSGVVVACLPRVDLGCGPYNY